MNKLKKIMLKFAEEDWDSTAETLPNPRLEGKPNWEHNCPKCIYLGTVQTFAGNYSDLYICDGNELSSKTIIRRYGPDDKYNSWNIAINLAFYLSTADWAKVALQLAVKKGVLSFEEVGKAVLK